jgi:hypothetical protein
VVEGRPVKGLCGIGLLVVVVVVMTVKTNFLLATYLGQWMMKVFGLSSVTMERFWMPG